MSKFLFQCEEHCGVRLGVDLTLQDPLGTRDREVGHAFAQLGPSLFDLLRNFRLRRNDHFVSLDLCRL